MTEPQSAADPDKPTTRRDLLKPVQLLALALVAAVFAGVITLVTMGIFQELDDAERGHVIVVSLVVAGIAFIATLVGIALLMLAVDPAQITKQVDGPVLDREKKKDAGGSAAGDGSASGGPRA